MRPLSIRPIICRILSGGLFLILISIVQAEPESARYNLWPEGAPVGGGEVEKLEVPITVHLPSKEKATGLAVIICPGGGYRGLVKGAEGHGIAKWLVGQGIVGVVLEYRLPKQRPFVPLYDAQRAIRTVRAHADEWGIKADRIGVMGFSAGGHLAATAITHFDEGKAEASDPIERQSSRPDFGILIYPVISMGAVFGHERCRTTLMGENPKPELIEWFSNEKQVTPETPPVYMAHAVDDKVVKAENCQQFHQALQAKKIQSHYLELPSGGHGLDRYQGPMWDAWQKGSLDWLKTLKW